MNFRRPACRVGLSQFRLGTLPARRHFTSPALDPPVQSYISSSSDPYLNLSIEHHLLQKSSPESAILFLYVNRPSIIIGRNQNPWLEVNLALLKSASGSHRPETEPAGLGNVDLVRRRSGGGTVFHDEGNVNWTVISPSAKFTRDKHAEMVVRALRSLGVSRSRVNERHDVVLDQGSEAKEIGIDPEDTHATVYQVRDGDGPRPLKVSGSAYKLTRQRALHHGTCLLSSPNLNVIPHYLHSPAKPFITARGVESVSSPVGNIMLSDEKFMTAVREHFGNMYEGAGTGIHEVDRSWLEIEGVKKGYDELRSLDWTFLQTPQFTVSSRGNSTPGIESFVDATVPEIEMTVRHGAITECTIALDEDSEAGKSLVGQRLQEITDWRAALPQPVSSSSMTQQQWEIATAWLQKMFPRVDGE